MIRTLVLCAAYWKSGIRIARSLEKGLMARLHGARTSRPPTAMTRAVRQGFSRCSPRFLAAPGSCRSRNIFVQKAGSGNSPMLLPTPGQATKSGGFKSCTAEIASRARPSGRDMHCMFDCSRLSKARVVGGVSHPAPEAELLLARCHDRRRVRACRRAWREP